MALNGARSAREEDTKQLTPDPLNLQPRRTKSYDEAIRSTPEGERSTTRHTPRTESLKRPSGAHSEANPDALHPELGGTTSLQRNGHALEADHTHPKSTPSITSNGDGRRGSSEAFAHSFFGPDHERENEAQDWLNDQRPKDIHQSIAQSSSPRNASDPAYPADGQAVNGWSSDSPVFEKQTATLIPDQTGEWRGISPDLQVNDAQEPRSALTQHDLDQDNLTPMDGGVRLPVEPGTGAPLIDPFPDALEEPGLTEDGVETFAKKLRRLRKRTDNILLKRTQWRQEYEKLDNCRQYLRESTNELMSALQIQRPEDTSQSNLKTKKKKKRKKPVTELDATGHELEDRLVSTSTQADSDPGAAEASLDASGSVESEATAGSREKIYDIFQHYLDDLEACAKQDGVARKLMEDLSSREFHVNTLLEDILTNMRSSHFAEGLRTELLEASLSSRDSSFKTASEDELPPLVAEYFELQGNIGIFLERLQDLDYEHQEGLVEREFVRDRGDPLEPPDDEFYANYHAQRAKTEQDLNEARKQLEIVDARCKQAGLDPEMHRNAAPSPRSMSPMPSAPVGQTGLMSIKPTTGAAAHPPLSPTLGAQSSLQIEGWLRKIPDNPLDAEPVSPPPVPQYEEKKPSEGSLASFEFRSFDLGVFGLPKSLDVNGYDR